MVTYPRSPEGHLYTVSTKKCQKRSKRGYPLCLTHFREGCAKMGRGPSEGKIAHQVGSQGRDLGTSGRVLEVGGYPLGATFEKYPILEGEGPHLAPHSTHPGFSSDQAPGLLTTFVVSRPVKPVAHHKCAATAAYVGHNCTDWTQREFGALGRSKCRFFCLPAALRTAVSGAFAPAALVWNPWLGNPCVG